VQRSSVFRAFAAIMAVWLAVCLAEPMQLHTCVMHGGLAIDTVHHGTPDAASRGAGMSGHHAEMASHGAADHSERGGTDHHARQCSCLGDCSAGRSAVGVVAATVALAVPVSSSVRAAYEYSSPSLVASASLLPFSNGPPVTSSRA
jgi:hypothetical protein